MKLDHIVYAAPNLEAACAAFAESTGCEPMAGGSHTGLGTRNALVSFGPGCYLEIIGPDPAQPLDGNLGGAMSKLEAPQLFHWALRVADLAAVASDLRSGGLNPPDPHEMRRRRPDGRELVWELMGLPGQGGAWPFFIDWRDSPHPTEQAPQVGPLLDFRVSLPIEDVASLAFADVDALELTTGPAELTLAFESPRGPVEWNHKDPIGFWS